MAANPERFPNPYERLVRVFEAEQESEALIVKGLLESAGIDCNMMSIDFPQDVLPMGGVALMVREEDAARAEQVIEEYRRTPSEEAAEAAELESAAAAEVSEEQEPE